MATESRHKDKVKHRRQQKKRKISLAARRGLKVFREKPGPRPGKGASSYLCGPCSQSKGVQVRHKHSSSDGRFCFGFLMGRAYLLPKPERPKPKPLRGEKGAVNVQ